MPPTYLLTLRVEVENDDPDLRDILHRVDMHGPGKTIASTLRSIADAMDPPEPPTRPTR